MEQKVIAVNGSRYVVATDEHNVIVADIAAGLRTAPIWQDHLAKFGGVWEKPETPPPVAELLALPLYDAFRDEAYAARMRYRP